MEKVICTACGAPLTPNTSQPFLVCEYCDTTIENKFYVEPEIKEPEPAPQPGTPDESAFETAEEEEASIGGASLLKTLLGVGTAIAAGSLRRRAAAARQPVVRPAVHSRTAPLQRTHQRVLRTAPHRHPEPPRTGGMGVRPSRPSRPGAGRPGGHGGRGGMGGPGGRHR